MNMKGYATNVEGGKARMINERVSWKDCWAIARNIRGMKATKAEKLLEDVIEQKAVIKYPAHNTGINHRKRGVVGRWPVKASKSVLKLLRNAISNAEEKGMSKEDLKVLHASAYKGQKIRRSRARGRWVWRYELKTTTMELVVGE